MPSGFMVSQTQNGQVTKNLIDPTCWATSWASSTASEACLDHYTYGLGLTSQVTAAGSFQLLRFRSDRKHDPVDRPRWQRAQQLQLSAFRRVARLNGNRGKPFHLCRSMGRHRANRAGSMRWVLDSTAPEWAASPRQILWESTVEMRTYTDTHSMSPLTRLIQLDYLLNRKKRLTRRRSGNT